MGYLSCNAESTIATCDSYNWDLTKKQSSKKHFKLRDFSYSHLHTATDGFSQSNFLGKGSHGSVYKAVLDKGNLIAAVKKTTNHPQENTNSAHCTNTTPADNEIETLSRVRSSRLVNLLGFGSDSSGRKLIVVEFMPNGSLYDLLHAAARPPGWARRVKIAVQVAKAVQHLHLSNPPVIHRDIKSSNILFDADWNARLGDFGLALRGHVEDNKVRCTPPAGTLGYLDPGYLAPSDLSAKSDVFSFGILLLEIISGRNAIDLNYSPPSVVDWAAPLIHSGDYAKIFDRRIGTPPEEEAAMRQLAVLAARCVRSMAEKRPAMTVVVESLSMVSKRVRSPIWNNLGCRVRRTAPSIKYEPLDETTTHISRKVSSVTSVELKSKHHVPRSKSIGSVHDIKVLPLDSNLERRRAGLAVKMPTVRLSKSRSTGALQGTELVNNSGKGIVLEVAKNPNVRELESSKLLVKLDKES